MLDYVLRRLMDSYADHVRKIFHVTEVNSQIRKLVEKLLQLVVYMFLKRKICWMVYDDEGNKKRCPW